MLRRHKTTYTLVDGQQMSATWWQFGDRVWRFRETKRS